MVIIRYVNSSKLSCVRGLVPLPLVVISCGLLLGYLGGWKHSGDFDILVGLEDQSRVSEICKGDLKGLVQRWRLCGKEIGSNGR